MHEILGKQVRDGVTGFGGVATARAEYWLGTPMVQIERSGDGAARWFAESRIEQTGPRVQLHPVLKAT